MLASIRKRPGMMCAYLGGAGASVLIVQTIGAWAPSVLHREEGLSPAMAALVFGLALLAAAPLGHLLAGVLVDKRGRRVTPMTIMAAGLLVMPLLWSIPGASSATAALRSRTTDVPKPRDAFPGCIRRTCRYSLKGT